jgi:hypothetical protein
VSIGPIALQGDPFVPVMKGIGALLGLNDIEPGVLPGRLVEMAVNGDIGIFHLWITVVYLIVNALSYITLLISKEFLTVRKKRFGKTTQEVNYDKILLQIFV